MSNNENENIINKYLDGDDFKCQKASSPKLGEESSLNSSTSDQDLSLLVSPSFSGFAEKESKIIEKDGTADSNTVFSGKRQSRCFPDQQNPRDIQPVIGNNNELVAEVIEDTKHLLDTSLCPSLGLGSVGSENESIEDSQRSGERNQDDNDGYVFKTTINENSGDILNVEYKSHYEICDENEGSTNNFSMEHDSKYGKDHNSFKLPDESTSPCSDPVNTTQDSQNDMPAKQDEITDETSRERRSSWNDDIAFKLKGVSNLIDSFDEKDKEEKSTVELKNKDSRNSLTNDNAEESKRVVDTSSKTDFSKRFSLEELEQKYPSPKKKEEKPSVFSSPNIDKTLQKGSNAISFIRNLLSPPEFLSPKPQRKSNLKALIENVKVSAEKSKSKLDGRDREITNSKNETKYKSDEAGIGHWRLSVFVPKETDLSLNVSPISCTSQNPEEETDEGYDSSTSGEILGEKILEDEQASNIISKMGASLYLSPNSENSFGTGMGSGSVEISKITKRKSVSHFPETRIPTYSGRRLSAEKMHRSSLEAVQELPLSNEKFGMSDEIEKVREVNGTPPLPEFSSIKDLSSARKKIDASSMALIERLQGASQRRKLLVSRSGESVKARNEYKTLDFDKELPNIGDPEYAKVGDKAEVTTSKVRASTFKPFKARPLPSTTSMIGHGGQLGVPKIPKRAATNPLSPKLGHKRQHDSPSRAIRKVRAEEKARKKILREALGPIQNFNVPKTVPTKRLHPNEDPYIPFKARPIQLAPKPLRPRDRVGEVIKLERAKSSALRQKVLPRENPYKPFKALPMPSSSSGFSKVKILRKSSLIIKKSANDKISKEVSFFLKVQ